MPITRITATYGRTFALRPFEVLKPEAVVEVTLTGDETPDQRREAWDAAWQEAREQIRGQLVRLTEQDRAIAEAVWNGLPPEMRSEIAKVAALREQHGRETGAPREPTPMNRSR